MKKKIIISNNFYYYILFLLSAFLFTLFYLGPSNISFNNTEWLFGYSIDRMNAQLSWKYYLADKWHFPIGQNPNYGLEVSNSIIFTDNVPLLAIIFKILKPFINSNFQYFSLWIFLCLFLQLFFSYKLINKFNTDKLFSFFSSYLFLLSPIMIFRLSVHPSLAAHWLILYAFNIAFSYKLKKKIFNWCLLIFLSLLVHLYFTAMIFIIYFSFEFEKFISKKEGFNQIIDSSIIIFFTFFVMYLIGYFSSNPVNAISIGYGIYKIDLFSFFDSQILGMPGWSTFLKGLNLTHFEGFSYLGLGNIFLIILAIFILIFNKNLKKNEKYNYNSIILRPANIFVLIFIAWSITTNLSIMGHDIFTISLPKYIFGALSIFGATGRFVWPVIYVLIFFSLLILLNSIRKKFSILLIICLIIIQFVDLSTGINNYSIAKNENKNMQIDDIWYDIEKNFDKIRTTYLYHNYGSLFWNIAPKLNKLYPIKTDIIINAALDRKKAASIRYNLIDQIAQKKLDKKTAYIIDNEGHLKQLKMFFADLNYGFFFRDNLWILLPAKKYKMNQVDKKKYNEIKLDEFKINQNYIIQDKKEFLGFGWSHNFGNKGVWSEGNISYLLFKNNYIYEKNIFLELTFSPFLKNNNKDFMLNIYCNNNILKKLNFFEDKNKKKILLDLTKCQKDKEIIIFFKFENLISPYDILQSPDARKLGILLESLIFKNN